MSIAVFHYSRYIQSNFNILKQGGGSVQCPAGWYTLPDILSYITQLTNVTWNAQTNVVSTANYILVQNTTAASMIGWQNATSYYNSSNTKPGFTVVFPDCAVQKELSPIETYGLRIYDTTYYEMADGKVFQLAKVEKTSETFVIEMINKKYIFNIESIPYVPFYVAHGPMFSNMFWFSYGTTYSSVSISNTTAQGCKYNYASDPTFTMLYKPWDKFFTMKMDVNVV